MKTVAGIRELKKQLSAYMRRVKAGETIIITDRGKPVGRLMPYSEALSDQLDLMQKSGFLAWSGSSVSDAEPVTINDSKTLISDILLEERE